MYIHVCIDTPRDKEIHTYMHMLRFINESFAREAASYPTPLKCLKRDPDNLRV